MTKQKILFYAGLAVFMAFVVYRGIVMLPKTVILAKEFSTSTVGLNVATESSTIDLKNGDAYVLTASIVKKQIGNTEVKMLAYNGSVPGPLFRVPQGAQVSLTLNNQTDVPTTLHPHGVRVENANDGAAPVTQKEIAPGESFTYQLKFSDAGMYWYHPHVREDYAQELGLYGGFLVTPTNPQYWNVVNREVPLFLDDVLISDNQITPFDQSIVNYTLMGRYGNTMLVNGQTNYSLSVQRGEVVRFYITNSANTRTLNLAIPGARIKQVGGDSGAYERDEFVNDLTISPSERVIVEVLFDQTGSFVMENKTPNKTYQFGKIEVTNTAVARSFASTFAVTRSYTETITSIDPFRPFFATLFDKKINLSVDLLGKMQAMMSAGGMKAMEGMDGVGKMTMGPETSEDGIEWDDINPIMNVLSTKANVDWQIIDQATGKKNEDIAWSFKVGDKIKVRIFNDPESIHPMQHPIHFHGQRFLVLNRNGVDQTNLVWKDTVLVPSGQYIDILLDISNSGKWMAHCHIAEHLEDGMMFNFNVQ